MANRKALRARPAPNADGNPLVETRRALDQAEGLRQQGKLIQAQKICEAVLQRHPDYVGMLHTLGLVLADRGQLKQALVPLIQATMLNPRDWKSLTVLSGVYLRLNAAKTAIRTLEQAREIQPDDSNILATLGEIHRANRDYQGAAEAYSAALERAPELVDIHAVLAECYLHMGKPVEAVTAAMALLKDSPHRLSPLAILARVPRALHDVDILEKLETVRLDAKSDAETNTSRIAFIRASLLDMDGQHDKAWEQLQIANAQKAKQFAAEEESDLVKRGHFLKRVQAIEPLAAPGPNDLSGDTVSLMILGPSRSGKTTAEKLVAALPGVAIGYENRILEDAVRQTFQSAGLLSRDWIGDLPLPLEEMFRDNYDRELGERAPGARVFTNTHPGHISAAGRFAAMIPQSRFLFMRRDRDDLALRIFMKNYDSGNSYAYALPTIRAYVDWYYAMIDRLVVMLPGRCDEISYEEMIDDPALVQRKAANLCGLDAASVDAAKVPHVGDDRGCGAPYADLMAQG